MATRIQSGLVAGVLLVAAGMSMGGCGGVVDAKDEQAFRAALGQTSITVFPAYVREGKTWRYETAPAEAIAALLRQESLATVTVATAEVPIASEWGMNQSRMWRESIADFADYVVTAELDTDYALLPEYLLSPNGKVMGVHAYVVTADGTPAWGIGKNSHHKEFNDVNPGSVADCTQIVLNVMRDELVR